MIKKDIKVLSDFDRGYVQALGLALAYWPADRACKCDPPMSGEVCYYFCWIEQIRHAKDPNFEF